MIPWPDLTTFLRAVAAEPGDDTARLAFADRLDEEGGQERCGACGGDGLAPGARRSRMKPRAGTAWATDCPTCSGSGWTLGVCARWAELVRVQCELSRWAGKDEEHCPECGQHWRWRVGAGLDEWSDCERNHRWCSQKYRDLSHCESTLLPDLAPVLMLGPECPECKGAGIASVNRCRCKYGFTGPLARLSPDAVEFRRGFPAVVRVARLADVWDAQPDEPTEWAKDVVRTWPVEEFVAGDRPAFQSGGLWYTHLNPAEFGCSLSEATKSASGYYGRSSDEAMTTALARAVADLTRAAVYPAVTSAASN